MKPKLLLRIAAVITLVFSALHTLGMPWTPALGPAERPVVEAMKSQAFDVGGAQRTYFNFYFAFGLTLSLYLLLQAVLLWQLATLAATDWRRARPMVAAFLVSFLAGAAIAWIYIFMVPALFGLVIALCLLLALLTGKAEGTAA